MIGRRRGRGLLGAMATTAVVAGTATATSRAVNNRMAAREQVHVNQQDQQMQMAQMQSQMEAMQAQQIQAVAAPSPTGQNDHVAQLKQLSDLKQSGAISETEFQTAKAKLLAS